ncbi:hypothetical protein A9Q78_06740 [Methylophaga sp. 41_12_T18]|nr:hypothetical protein A9Q78_06740 [Methylophaga sp. 41_12_T18]
MKNTLLMKILMGWLLLVSPLLIQAAELSVDHAINERYSQAVDIPIVVSAGDYVFGQLISNDAEVDLILLDDNVNDLAVQRKLINGEQGEHNFLFVATDLTKTLRLQATDDSNKSHFDYQLKIIRHIPKSEQVAPSQPFVSPTIAALADNIANNVSTDAIWATIASQGTPIIEEHADSDNVVMTFAYKGAKHNVRIFGAPASEHEFMEQLDGSDIWYKSFIVPNTSRLSYRLSPDVPQFSGTPWQQRVAILATAQADPLNKHPFPAKYAANNSSPFNYFSSVNLATDTHKYWQPQNNVATGSVQKHRFSSDILGNQRNIWLYTSANYVKNDPNNVLLLMFDGKHYTSKVDVPMILDNLVANNKIPAIAAVLIDNPSQKLRASELPDNKDFAKAMATEILPWAEQTLGIKSKPQTTVLSGSSYGGLASTSIALRHPEQFGNALSMSGSYWWSPEDTPAKESEYTAIKIATMPKQPVRFFLSAGLFESFYNGKVSILETNRHLQHMLTAKGYDSEYKEYASGHDYYVWQDVIADGLIHLFGEK